MRRLLSVLLVLALFCSSVPFVSATGSVLTSEERIMYLEAAKSGDLSFVDMVPLMDSDPEFAQMVMAWLFEESEPIDGGDDCDSGISAYSNGLEYDYSLISRPDLMPGDKQVSTTVRLFLRTNTGCMLSCSGVLLANDVVVTSAHCVYSSDNSGSVTVKPNGSHVVTFPYHTWMTSVLCVPVAYPLDNPDGSAVSWVYPKGYAAGDVDKIFVDDVWYSGAVPNEEFAAHDLAVIPLFNKSSNFTDTFYWKLTVPTSLGGNGVLADVRQLGYPADSTYRDDDKTKAQLASLHMGYGYAKKSLIFDNLYKMTLAGYHGMSGGPIFDMDGNLIGVFHGHVSGDNDYPGRFCGLDGYVSTIYEYTQGAYWHRDAGSTEGYWVSGH